MVADAAGNLYGTTLTGGPAQGRRCPLGCGVVFELSPATNGSWQETVLYSFTGLQDGGSPIAGVVLDAQGNIYGTTYLGGRAGCNGNKNGCGVVFELSPTSTGWQESVLHTFAGNSDGATPYGGLVLDSSGNLYGTTTAGGVATGVSASCAVYGCGTVFEITP